MADVPIIPMGEEPGRDPTAPRTPCMGPGDGRESGPDGSRRLWQSMSGLSSTPAAIASTVADRAEAALAGAGFDRAPWLAVMFAGGILAWFALPLPWQWVAGIALALGIAGSAAFAWRGRADRERLRTAAIGCALVFAAGMAVIWARSEAVGAEPIPRPVVERIQGYVLERQDQPAKARTRLTLAVRGVAGGDADAAESGRKIRVNVPLETLEEARGAALAGGVAEGAVVRMRVRLMPPASPMLPGGYDFARAAWFKGLAATGSIIGPLEIVTPAPPGGSVAAVQRALSDHVRARVEGSAGTIAAAFASGDRGAIAEDDAEAMRDAGLTHLLAISGLHVSAVVAAAYLVTLRLLALFPALALRVRLPVVAAAIGALAGIGYTVLTGAQVPTVRACVAAMLVLVALAMGRDALSLRMVAAAAVFVLLLWPESVVGPSFQMSFCAVLAIVALHSSGPVRAFLAPREEGSGVRLARGAAMLFATGLVIELALMPIVLFHFHRAGVYGAVANVVAIPLVTFVSMPLIAGALVLDLIGLGAPLWWLVERSLELLLAIAHFTSAQPGAVKLMPQMSWTAIALFAGGGLWLALWSGRWRALGFAPMALATMLVITTPIPDVLIGREGRHVGITIAAGEAGGGAGAGVPGRAGGGRAGDGWAGERGEDRRPMGGATVAGSAEGDREADPNADWRRGDRGGQDRGNEGGNRRRSAPASSDAHSDGGRRLVSLRDSRSSYSRDNLLELASVRAEPIPIATWPGARCSSEFCTVRLERGGRSWDLLLARNRVMIEERRLAAACDRADIVVADRFLPRSCRPRWLKADSRLLKSTGGLALDLEAGTVTSVADTQGEHGWWQGWRR